LKIYPEPSLHQTAADLVEGTITETSMTTMRPTHDELVHKLVKEDNSLSMMTITTTMLDLLPAPLLAMLLDVHAIRETTTINDHRTTETTEGTTTLMTIDHLHHAATVANQASNLRQKLLDLVA